MGDSQNQSSRVNWMLPTSLVVAAAAIAGTLLLNREKDPPVPQVGDKPQVQKITREASLKLLRLRDLALGHLENHEFDQAEPLLVEITKQIPDDPFGPRNLLICRELAVEKLDPGRDVEKLPQALASANDAADQLAKVEPESHVTHVLTARIALKENDPIRAAAALRRATEMAPESAPVWYDLFLLNPLTPGEPPATETVNALRKVYELEPDNLFVLKDWLPLQTQLKDADLARTIAKAKETLGPFADVIKTNIRIDVRQMLDKLATSVEAGQWPVATSTAMTVRNVIVSEASRDERYVRWNSLEYALVDFGSAFYASADLAEPSSPPTSVKFEPADELLVRLPDGVRELALVDFDLNGRFDSAALLEQQIVVTMPLVLQSADAKVTETKIEIGAGFARLIAVDLDDDVDPKLKDRPVGAVTAGSATCQMADPDLIAFGPVGLRVFENRVTESGQREFVEKQVGDRLAALREVKSVVPGDLDLDGDLDFVTIAAGGVQMWSNRGNWSFEEITDRSTLPPVTLEPAAAVAVDWDRDTDLDLLVAGSQGFGILENRRHGSFRWRDLVSEFAGLKGATSLLVEQWGNRPSWSVVGAGVNGLHLVGTQTSAAGVVTSSRAISVSKDPLDRVISLDFDNDGVRDLLAMGASRTTLWRGLADGTLQQFPSDAGPQDATTVVVCDLDRDGDEDLVFGSTGKSSWLLNQGGNANGWLDVSLVAMQIKANEQNYSKRVNHAGIGSLIEIRAGNSYQAQVVRGTLTHFGLGPQKSADALRVLWTNGIPHNRIAPAPQQWICEEQKLHGSCPYLYTWDGDKFAFATDLLWNAPLGLKFAEDVIAPWREWEYLKIDADKLRPKDGEYQLRVTAELWEVEYFDQIKLFAIDHPVRTQIFTNEKVGPASLAEHRVHTVSVPHSPIAARDTNGRDILDQVKSRDGIFTKTYDRKLAQGLTTEHFLELDLGPWPGESAGDQSNRGENRPVVTLFLTGWMYPGSTSLSVQHSQNSDQAKPRPPALHAVDSNGQWREVRPFMGFPGGKTKTIAVDLTDVFAPESTDHRLRIVTNMEFYWDAAFFTVDDQPVEFRQTELPLVNASLLDRGGVALRQWPAAGNGPETFDYKQLVPGDMWPPIDGKFTRLGDVLPLLRERDDHLVVMHPGDEIQISFGVPAEPVPDGWVRDFVIYNVGWDKDCDLNTVYGETSEPLPFRDMTVYALRDGEARPMDAAYVQYLQRYQTRTRARAPFWNGMPPKRGLVQ